MAGVTSNTSGTTQPHTEEPVVNRRVALIAVPLLLTTCGSLVATAEAAKAPKPVCNVITDAAGDAKYNGNVPGADGDDVISGDISSDGKTLTGVIRTAALAANDPVAPFGRAYFAEFAVKGVESVLFVSARTYPTGTQFVYGYRGVDPTSGLNTSYTLGMGTGAVDLAKKEVRISAPNLAFAPSGTKLSKGTKLISLTATTWRIAGQGVVASQQVGPARAPVGGVLLPFDDGAGTTYLVGAPSCVKPGS